MKKNLYFTILLMAISFIASGQSQRFLLIEEATNASCGPCASQNPAFDALLQNNLDKLVAIKYHWDFPGYDPMHNHNTVENNARVSYYNISGVPHALIDGSSITGSNYTGAPANCSQAKIDAAYAIPSPFEITISHEVIDDVIFVVMLIEATEEISGNLRARMAVVEKLIHFNNAPGSNGETDFHDVMKKMLPDPSGIKLNSTINAGEYFIFEQSWELANIYDMDELGVVGFIQDHTSKLIHQGADSSTDPIIPLYSNDAEILEVENITSYNCLGEVSPVITIRNNGSENLTSLDIQYSVNGGAPQTYSWTGNLSFLERDEIELEEISFNVMDENSLVVSSENTNGVGDDYVINDTYIMPFDEAIHTSNQIRLVLITDDNPQETTWEVFNSNGEVILSGGPYAQAGTVIQEYHDIDIEDCYRFLIHDAGNNGLCCEFGSGAWGLYDADGNVEIGTGGMFADRDSVNFEVGGFTGVVNSSKRESSYSVYPNPTNGISNITLDLNKDENISYSIFNILGKEVKSVDLGLLQPGEKIYPVNMLNYEPGVYFILLNISDKSYTHKLILSK